MSRLAVLLFLLFASCFAHAQFFLSPSVGAGYNTVQGNYYQFGLDAGYFIDDNFYAGVGGFYASGDHAQDDRQIGGGPFVGYHQPLLSFLSVQLREDIDYVDVHDPVLLSTSPDVYTHSNLYGVESVTYAGIHISFTRNFGLAAGYRLVAGLTNNSIASGRSGVAFGATLGF